MLKLENETNISVLGYVVYMLATGGSEYTEFINSEGPVSHHQAEMNVMFSVPF